MPPKISQWTECQQTLFDAVFAREAKTDVILHSQTGSGKTIAYLLPPLDKMVRAGAAGGPQLDKMVRAGAAGGQIVVVVPTRELATQVGSVAAALTAGLGLRSAVLCGGLPMGDGGAERPDIVVGTPGALLNNRSIIDPATVSTVVVDEVDRLLDFGFIAQLEELLKYFSSAHRPALVLASATFPTDVERIISRLVSADCVTVRAGGQKVTPEGLVHELVEYSPIHFHSTLERVLRDPSGQSLVLFPTTRALMFFYSVFKTHTVRERVHMHALHGRMLHEKRRIISEKFSTHKAEDEAQIMFATDVAARGLDFPNLRTVVQIGFSGVDDPVSQFVHRSGRTARGGEPGRSVLMVGRGLDAGSKWLAKVGEAVLLDRFTGIDEIPSRSGRAEPTAYQRHLSSKCLESLLSWFLERRGQLGIKVDEELTGPARTMEAKAQLVRAVTDMVRSTGVPQPKISSKLAKKLRIDDIPGLLLSDRR